MTEELELAESIIGKQVEVQRAGALWSGRVVSVADQPAMLLEQSNGDRVMLPISGSHIDLDPLPTRMATVLGDSDTAFQIPVPSPD